MNRTWLKLALAGLLVVSLSGCKAGADKAAPVRPETYVRVATAELVDYAPNLVLTGSLAARNTVPQQFQLTSRIVSLPVSVGDHVAEGDLLARLDASVQDANLQAARATLVAAEAQLREAKSVFEREKTLFDQSLSTKSSFDAAQAAYVTAQAKRDSADAQLKNAMETLSYTSLTAASDGIVTASNFELGEVAQAGATAFIIAEDGPRDAVFHAPEQALTADPMGREVNIRLVSDPSVTSKARVREVSPTLDPASATVMLKAELYDMPKAMGLNAAVIGSAHGDVNPRYVLPWGALWRDADGPAVWVVDPDTHKVGLRAVTVDSYLSEQVVIKAGLEPGELVVTEGTKVITPGQVVTILEEAGQ
ncbi:MAG: efflux RND transporter periplasmic adaptor subunit [Maritimibacter sp.]